MKDKIKAFIKGGKSNEEIIWILSKTKKQQEILAEDEFVDPKLVEQLMSELEKIKGYMGKTSSYLGAKIVFIAIRVGGFRRKNTPSTILVDLFVGLDKDMSNESGMGYMFIKTGTHFSDEMKERARDAGIHYPGWMNKYAGNEEAKSVISASWWFKIEDHEASEALFDKYEKEDVIN